MPAEFSLLELEGMPIARSPADLRVWTATQRANGRRIGFVPTMGALHAGHMALVHHAHERSDVVVVSVFVNPLQFGPREDLDAYPRTLPLDAGLCRKHGVELIFAPTASGMYPSGFETHVEPGPLAQLWCGASRPGHFRGVATVVAKLLNLVMADVAVFGEKDWQQLQVIARMARDLNHPTEIVGVPTLREPDGLALSSRNVFLTPDERRGARAIPDALRDAQALVSTGERDPDRLTTSITARISDAGGRVDYVGIVDPETLVPRTTLDGPAQVLVAAYFGRTRLIDNARLTAA
jgi:pantoate--beta-alanine ligase